MFKNFYTTKMSGNKEVLQKRFAKIRQGSNKTMRIMALVMTFAILATTAFSTIVMAAIGSDGFEALDKNEAYIVATMKTTMQVDLDKMPEWVRDISSDGSIHFQIDYLNVKHPTREAGMVGNIRQTLSAKIIGDKGSTTISDGLSAANYNYSFSFCIFADDEKALLLWSPLDDNLDITSYSVCFTTPGGNDLAFAHTEKHKENYIEIAPDTIQYVGDFKGILKQTEYFTMNDYFTFYEKDYQNKNVEGVDIKVLKLDADGLSLKANVSRTEPDTLKICVRKKENMLKSGIYVSKSLAEVNGKDFRIDEEKLAFSNFTEKMKYSGSKDAVWTGELSNAVKENYLRSGEEYVVDFILTKTNEDESISVLYRQREYITIPSFIANLSFQKMT